MPLLKRTQIKENAWYLCYSPACIGDRVEKALAGEGPEGIVLIAEAVDHKPQPGTHLVEGGKIEELRQEFRDLMVVAEAKSDQVIGYLSATTCITEDIRSLTSAQTAMKSQFRAEDKRKGSPQPVRFVLNPRD